MPAIGLFVIPVLEAPDGTLVQDTTRIFEYLEARHPEPVVVPSSPLQNAVAWLIERLRLGGPAAGGHALPLVLPPRAGDRS